MQPNLVHINSRRQVEGAMVMGSIEFIHPSGKTTKMDIDGTITTEWNPPTIEMCDSCETWQNLSLGQYTASDGLTLIWLCQHCK